MSRHFLLKSVSMLTLGERIRHIRESILKVNQASFADNLGFARIATISDYEKNKRNPDITTVRKIASIGNVTLEWLLTGRGPISVSDAIKPHEAKEPQSGFYPGDFVEVKIYDMALVGAPRDFPGCEPVGFMPVSREDFNKGPVAIRVRGVGMVPNIIDGAIAGLDTANKAIVSGDIYAVWLNYEGATIKRLFVYPDRIILRPDNPTFPESSIPTANLGDEFIIGRVVWLYQRY